MTLKNAMENVREASELYAASIIQDVEEALQDSDADRVIDNSEVRRQFKLDECAE